MDLLAHLSVIFQRKWQVLLASIAVAALVFAWRTSTPPTYRGSALLSVVSGRALSGEAVNQDDARFVGDNYAAMALTRPLVTDAARRAGVAGDVAALQRRLHADSSQAGYLRLSADAGSRTEATRLSRGLADALLSAVQDQQNSQLDRQLAPVDEQISRVEQQLNALKNDDPRRTALELQYQALVQNATQTRLRPADRLALVAPARADDAPVAPHPKKDAALALIAALIINAELAVLLAALSGRFIGADVAEEITKLTGLPVLAELPQGGSATDGAVVEAFRSLRTNLLFLGAEGELRSVAIVGGERGSGKSFVAEHLARAMAGPGSPVVLVDGDLRNPSLHVRLGVQPTTGLADALAPPYTLVRPVELADQRNLRFLPAGTVTGDPAALFSGSLFERLLERLRTVGVTVVDTPPLGLFADGAAAAQDCDATILVVDIRKARRREVSRMVETLAQVGVTARGIVLNRVKTGRRGSYGGYSQDRPSRPVLREAR